MHSGLLCTDLVLSVQLCNGAVLRNVRKKPDLAELSDPSYTSSVLGVHCTQTISTHPLP